MVGGSGVEGRRGERPGEGSRGEGSRIPERRRPVCGTPARSVESRRLRHNPISSSFFSWPLRPSRPFGPRLSLSLSLSLPPSRPSALSPFHPTKRLSPSLPRRCKPSPSNARPIFSSSSYTQNLFLRPRCSLRQSEHLSRTRGNHASSLLLFVRILLTPRELPDVCPSSSTVSA